MWGKRLAEVDLSALKHERDVVTFGYKDPFGQQAEGFVVLWRGQRRAYRNLCPHWSVPMDREGAFFGEEGVTLRCHVHGASFDPATGRCTLGPPEGDTLEVFDLQAVPGRPHVYIVLRRSGLSLS